MQLKEVEEFKEFDSIDNRFLRFEKDFLSNCSADKATIHP